MERDLQRRTERGKARANHLARERMPEPAKGHEPEQQVNEHDHHDDHEDDRNHRLDGFWNGQPVDHKPDQPEDQSCPALSAAMI